MSSDEDYLFDEDDVDSGNESPENSDDDEEDWGMDIGLGRFLKIFSRLKFSVKIFMKKHLNETFPKLCFLLGDEQGPSGSIEGQHRSGRSGDPGGRGDPDDYYYEV